MDDPTQGTEAPSSAVALADPTAVNDSLPLSVDDFKHSTPEVEDDGVKKARAIFRKLHSEKAATEDLDGLDDEPAKQPAAERKTPESTPASADTPAEKSPAAKSAGEAEHSAARDALIRDGWSGADLDKLPPERILELGQKRASLQKQQDGFGRQKHEEVATLKARLAELEGGSPTAQPQAGSTAAAPPAVTTGSFPATVEAELDKLGEYASPEVKDVMKKSFAALHQQMQAQFQGQLDRATQAAEQQMIGAARVKASPNYPGLRDETKFQAVTAKMRTLAKTGDYGPGDMDKLMEDACKITLPAASITDVQRQMLEASQKAKNGQMDAGQTSKTSKDDAKRSDEDRSRHILRLMNKGKSKDEARRIALQAR